MKKNIFLLFLLFIVNSTFSQNKPIERPKLVVGIVVDQMRYDYLTRFYSKYGNDGFKRLINDGFNIENGHYNYIPTYTAVGHASIYTGATPQNHGIIGNNWYDKVAKKSIYCVDDDKFLCVGSKVDDKKSPKNLLTTTLTDELKMTQINKGKVIGVSIKDRSAMLPVGHTGDAAYWFNGAKEGRFVTSNFYVDKLPNWVEKFNNSDISKKYANSTWNTLYDIDTYIESIEDDNKYEGIFKGKKSPTFPYNLKKLKKKNGNYDIIKYSVFGNSIVKDFAEAAVIGENLGKTKGITDFLAISFSSTDYIGHFFGVDSKEIEDTYLRLDKDIASFLKFLDTNVGVGEYTVFLTSDHAAVQVPSYLKDLKIPGNYFDVDAFQTYISDFTKSKYNSDEIIENFSNWQLFLNKEKLQELNLNVNDVSSALVEKIIDYPSISKVVAAETLQKTNFDRGILKVLQNGYNQKRSGDVLLVPNPNTIVYSKTGSTHGSGYNYDTHVPIIFYGKGIKKGKLKRNVFITDIAPTICNLLQISFPNASTGTIIYEALEK